MKLKCIGKSTRVGLAIISGLALGSSANAADITGSLTKISSAMTYDLTTSGDDDWAVFTIAGTSNTSIAASDEKKDATILNTTVSIIRSGSPLQTASRGTSASNYTFVYTDADAQSGVGNSTSQVNVKREYTANDLLTPTLGLSGTATGIGSAGTFQMFGGSHQDSYLSMTVEIGTIASPSLYGTFTTDTLTGANGGFSYQIGSFAYSGVTDPDAVLTWTYTSTDNPDATVPEYSNKLILGAIAINVAAGGSNPYDDWATGSEAVRR